MIDQDVGLGNLVSRAPIGIFVACTLLALLTPVAHAANVANLPALQVAQLADTQPAPAPATIIDGSLDKTFQSLPTPSISASSSTDRWYRIELSVDWSATELPILSLQNTGHTRVWIYAPPSFQPHLLQSMQTDTHSPFALHTLADVLPRDLRAGQPIYLRLEKSKRHPQIALTLTDLASYQTAELNHVRVATAFESIQAAMLLIGLFLWLLLRDRVFIYFSGYIGTQLIYMMLINGEIYELPGGSVFYRWEEMPPGRLHCLRWCWRFPSSSNSATCARAYQKWPRPSAGCAGRPCF